MRNVPGLEPMLARATHRANQQPTFRFHGHRSPVNRTKTPVLAAAPSTKAQDGIVTLRIYEPIDSWGGSWGISAVEFLDALDSLDQAATDEIRLHINSPGGEVWEALAILNSLRDFDAKVTAQVDGIAASAASFIAAAADETVMAPNTQLMIHDAWGLCVGNAADMHSTGDILDAVSDNIASIYAAKAGNATADWRAVMRDEAWYSAQEAVDQGLADRIAGEEPAEDPADTFDLEGIGMKYGGRADAPAPPQPGAALEDVGVVDNDEISARRERHQTRRHAENARRLA